MKNTLRLLTFAALLLTAILVTESVYAVTYEVSGNGPDSNNSININQNNSTNVNQSNAANVNNNIDVNANTGGNSINGGVGDGSIKTGDINTNINITNNLNKNKADVDCNNCPKPTDKPGSTPTPTGKPGESSKSGNGGVGGASAGGSGGSSGGSQPGVLGLPTTSGENGLLDLIKILPAFASFAAGITILRKNA